MPGLSSARPAAGGSAAAPAGTPRGGASRFARTRSLRAQLIIRTLVPIGVLVIAFTIAGQIAYTQVTEALVKSRDTELARVEAARMADFMTSAMESLQSIADSPVLLSPDDTQVHYALRSETVSEHFDLVHVADASGRVRAASNSGGGSAVVNRAALASLRGPGLPSVLGEGTGPDGRKALALTLKYIDPNGAFAGVVEGIIYYGSYRLGISLTDLLALDSQQNPAGVGAHSYLVDGSGIVLWHPEASRVGRPVGIAGFSVSERAGPSAIITRSGGEQVVLGYAPLNLGRLLPRTALPREWVQWYVVTQERWSEVVAPLNSVLLGLLVLAFLTFIIAMVLVTRSASALTRPVASLVAATRALSAGRLKRSLEVSGPTEIEELAHQFSAMADQVQASYASLESKVEERTHELARANAELERRLVESVSVQKVAADLAGTAGLDEILRTIGSSAAQALGAEGSVVWLPCEDEPDKLEASYVWNLDYLPVGTQLGLYDSLSGRAVLTKQPQRSDRMTGDPAVDQRLAAVAGAGPLLSVPLISRGQAIGAINIVNKQGGTFTETDLHLLTVLANQAAVAIERARLYKDAQQQLKALRTINDLALSVTLARDVDETLLGGIEQICKLVEAAGAVVLLYDQKANKLQFGVSYGLAPEHAELLMLTADRVSLENAAEVPMAMMQSFVRQQPVSVPDMMAPEYRSGWLRFAREELGDVGDRYDKNVVTASMIALPLSVREKRLGTMGIFFRDHMDFDEHDVRLHESFAKILALAVHNSQLLEQTSKLATVEERARLARELHDSVTQSLFSLNLTVRAAKRVLKDDSESAVRLMDDVHELAQGSLAEMRALIFELRPQALENEGLVLALQKHADAVRARSGLKVLLETRGDRRLPMEVEEALYQIAREALHNVVKHAHATEAKVQLDLEAETVSLSVQDDGRGFHPDGLHDAGGSHIGTSTMRERAQAIRGDLVIDSEPGRGTAVRVCVEVPTVHAQVAARA